MKRRDAQPDHYAILQLTPRATDAEIAAAYERLRDVYDPDRTANAAPELQELASKKRQQIEAAFRDLGDRHRRAAYDRQQGFAPIGGDGAENAIDFRPLPPARRQERDAAADYAPPPLPRSRGIRGWLAPTLTAIAGIGLLLLLILSGVRVTGGQTALATPTIRGITLPFNDTQLRQFRAAAESTDTAANWTALGNAIFDNLQTLRENAPQSPQYRGQLDQWLAVVDAYDRSLALQDSDAARSSRAVALMSYGVDADDEARRAEALAEVQRGIRDDVRDPRALLNYGFVLSLTEPPRVAEALAQWRRIIEIAPDSPEAENARLLLRRFGENSENSDQSSE
jgi:curved DNA-binding protein CbpA